jgi:predicted phosphodiesterase
MSTSTWLHLSDLHFTATTESEIFNQKIVLNALWRDIATQIARGLQPDFVVFTGDVAYHGKDSEYKLACEGFFDPLLHVTGLEKDRLFVVPGNHDVDWEAIDPLVARGMQSLRDDRDRINQFLSSEQDRSYFFRKFHAYAAFINNYFENALCFSDMEYFYTRIFEVHKRKLAVIGLNSPWMSACVRTTSGKVRDRGQLLIGERQLVEALDRTNQADLRIALLHHPLDWLDGGERFDIEKRLNANCDFVLHGHWHVPQVNVIQSMAGQAVYIPAGSVYANRSYTNSYNFVQLDFDSREARVYLRRYNDSGPSGPEWTKDILSTGEANDGQIVLQLALKVPSALSAKRILFVEDRPEWQRVIQSILVPPEYELEVAESFLVAKTKIGQHFDLILMNLCLANENDYLGVSLLDDLRGSHVPRVVLTGSSIGMRGLFERYGVHEAFVKGPTFNMAQFRRTIKEATGSPH